MLDAEAALAAACADVGLVPREAADEIAAACRAELYDAAAIAADARAAGNPAIPLVRALTARLSPAAAAHVHRGATSQDIIDTAISLTARRSLPAIVRRPAPCGRPLRRTGQSTGRRRWPGARCCSKPCRRRSVSRRPAGWRRSTRRPPHWRQPMSGSPRSSAAPPARSRRSATTARRWRRIRAPARPRRAGPPLARRPDGPATLAAALGIAAGACGKAGLDIVLLAQTEVGEAHEAGEGRGGSSTMPHKRNPVAAVAAIAAARRAPGLVATMLAVMAQEHERAAGGWQAEWETMPALLAVAAEAAPRSPSRSSGWSSTPGGCTPTSTLAGDLPLAEAATTQLTPALGRAAAHALVRRRAGERPPRARRSPRRWPPRDTPSTSRPSTTSGQRPRSSTRRCRPAPPRANVTGCPSLSPRGDGAGRRAGVVLSNSLGTTLADVGPPARRRSPAIASCGTTCADTAARRCPTARARSPTSAATWSRCSTGSRSSAPRWSASRSAA